MSTTKKPSARHKESGISRVSEPEVAYGHEPLSFEKVWLMFKETDRQFKETDRQFKETDKKFQETDKKFQESERIMTNQFQKTDKKIKELSELFTSQWGKLVESLVNGAVVRVLNEAGIKVFSTSERVKGCVDGVNYEYDIVAYAPDEVVAIEVKTTLKPSDVKAWLKKLEKFRQYQPSCANSRVMGAVAFLRADAGSDLQAMNSGLFVIKALNDSAVLLNPPGFKAKLF